MILNSVQFNSVYSVRGTTWLGEQKEVNSTCGIQFTCILMGLYMNIALRRFLHNHGNIATEGSPKSGLFPTLFNGTGTWGDATIIMIN